MGHSEYLLSAFVLLAVSATSINIWLKRKNRSDLPAGKTDSMPGFPESVAFNPLDGVSFKDFMDPGKGSELVTKNSLDWMKNHLGDGASIVINAAAQSKLSRTMLASFTDSTTSLLKSGKASLVSTAGGDQLTARVGGAFRENAIATDKTIVTAANVASMVVGLAHIISGFDNAKKLQAISGKVDKLLELRDMDNMAILSATYEELQHELSISTATDSTHLKALRLNLRTIRAKWLNEISRTIASTDMGSKYNPLRLIAAWRKRKAHSLEHELVAQFSRLKEVKAVLLLEQTICLALGESSTYLQHTAPQVVQSLKEIEMLYLAQIDHVQGALGVKKADAIALIQQATDQIAS